MRIVGGALSGRRIPGRPPRGTRPTSDRVREAIASALVARDLIEGARVLDLYAGTGALSFEALSRGAASADLFDASREAVAQIRRSAEALGLAGRCRAHRVDLGRGANEWLARIEAPVDLVFLDPPYAQVAECASVLSALARGRKLRAGAAVVLEHATKEAPQLPEGFAELTRYRYGDTSVLLAEAPEEEAIE